MSQINMLSEAKHQPRRWQSGGESTAAPWVTSRINMLSEAKHQPRRWQSGGESTAAPWVTLRCAQGEKAGGEETGVTE
jgi:hypothetical protein